MKPYKTCFDGMYRVNRNGDFNVPIGTKNHFIDDVELFDNYSLALRHTHIRTQDFVATIRAAGDGGLIFADPPYTVLHTTKTALLNW